MCALAAAAAPACHSDAVNFHLINSRCVAEVKRRQVSRSLEGQAGVFFHMRLLLALHHAEREWKSSIYYVLKNCVLALQIFCRFKGLIEQI